MYEHIWVHIHTCEHVLRPEVYVENHLQSLLYLIHQGRSLNQTQHLWTWLLTPGIPYLCLLRLELQVDITPTWYLHGSWGSELWSSHLPGKHFNHQAISPEQVVVRLKTSMSSSPGPNSPVDSNQTTENKESPGRPAG